MHFTQDLVYGEEKVQMCTESSDLQFRDTLFVVEKVFFSFLCTHTFPVLAAVSLTPILEGISHLQGWRAAPCESSCDHQRSSGLVKSNSNVNVRAGVIFFHVGAKMSYPPSGNPRRD